MSQTERVLRAVALAAASVVTIAVAVQALELGSLDPIWTLAWLPAVLVAIAWPARSGGCGQRLRRRRQP